MPKKEKLNEDTALEETESFEEKLKNAKEILERLSDPGIPLKDAMREYKKGITILNDASKIIEDAKLEYEQLQFSKEGQ